MKKEIAAALRVIVERDETVEMTVADALRVLDAVARDNEADLDPHLRHYLQKRSYAKAFACMQENTE